MSASYPYLTIAKAYNIPYGAVLQYVSMLDGTWDEGRAQDVIQRLDEDFRFDSKSWAIDTRNAYWREQARREKLNEPS